MDEICTVLKNYHKVRDSPFSAGYYSRRAFANEYEQQQQQQQLEPELGLDYLELESESYQRGMQEKLNVIWWQLAPYVHAEQNGTSQLNGFVYSIFLDSVTKCLGWSGEHEEAEEALFDLARVDGQGDLLEAISSIDDPVVGLPVILESNAVRDAPRTFIRVLSTIGLTWMYHHDPPEDNVILKGLASVWPLLCIVIIFTGYAALFIWLAERSTETNSCFRRKFHLGVFDAYWYAFVSATTVGYGDKVPRSIVGKVLAIAWMLCGICSTSVFTAAIATFFGDLTEESSVAPPPLHNVKVGIINSSIDFRLVAERGAQPVEFGNVDDLLAAMNNHDVDSIAIDPNVYCLVHEQLNQTYEFRVGSTSPTVVGYLFNVKNESLLECMRTAAFYQQNEFDHHLKELYQKVERQEEMAPDIQENMFGADGGGLYICYAALGLLFLYTIAFITDTAVQRIQRAKRMRMRNAGAHANSNSNSNANLHSIANSNPNANPNANANATISISKDRKQSKQKSLSLLYCNGDDAKPVEI